jgi:hypothetical protein
MMRVAFIDPGLQVSAVALFDLSLCGAAGTLAADPAGWVRASRGFVSAHSRRLPGADVTDRCASLASWLPTILVPAGVRMVGIEVPHKHGAYDRKRRRQRGKGCITAAAEAKLHQAIGTLRVAARQTGATVVEIPARYGIYDKSTRHDKVRAAFARAGQDVDPLRNEHSHDAAWLGMWYLGRNLDALLRELEAA